MRERKRRAFCVAVALVIQKNARDQDAEIIKSRIRKHVITRFKNVHCLSIARLVSNATKTRVAIENKLACTST